MTETTRTITATATKSGDWWVLDIPELETSTMLRRLTKATEQVAALAATQLNLEPDTISVQIERQMPEEATTLWQEYKEAMEQAEQARVTAAGYRNEAVMALHQAQYSPADIAGFTGLSSSRINQIVKEANLDSGQPLAPKQ